MGRDKIVDELLVTYEYSYAMDNWVAPIMEELEPVGVDEALFLPSGVERCIWEIALHVATWNENIVDRVRIGDKATVVGGHWPPLPLDKSDAAWQTAKRALRTSLDRIRLLLEESDAETLRASPYGIPDLVLRFVHIGYHAGQITKLREWYRYCLAGDPVSKLHS